VPDVQLEINNFIRIAGVVLFAGCVLWVIYLAIEPYVRRFWPDGILGWTRLMSGYVRDPRVGRDVLLGCAVSVGLGVFEALYNYLPPIAGYPSALPFFQANVGALINASTAINTLYDMVASGVFVAMFVVLGYVLLRLALRRTGLAIAAFFAVLLLIQSRQVLASAAPLWMAAIFQIVVTAVMTTVVVRYGLLATAVAAAVGNVLEGIPITYALSHWTATTSNLALAVVLGLALFGFYASRAGQPLFGKLDVKT
jgi:hypothetical protein